MCRLFDHLAFRMGPEVENPITADSIYTGKGNNNHNYRGGIFAQKENKQIILVSLN